MRVTFSRLLAAAVVALGFAAPAQAIIATPTFTGYYALASGNWTMSGGGVGGTTIDITDPSTLTFNGGDAGCALNNCIKRFSITAAGGGDINFDWNFSTFDLDTTNDPALLIFEQFGYGVNGIETNLTEAGVSPMAGSKTVTVNAGDTFAFFYDCMDCNFGPGTASVVGFSAPMAPIPEPEAWALMLAGIGLVGTIARRRLVK